MDAAPPSSRQSFARVGILPGVLLAIAAVSLWPRVGQSAAPARPAKPLGALVEEEKSEFSTIRIRRSGDVRYMCFVRDNGVEVCETELNVKKPHELVHPYGHAMFASYLFRPEQKRVLIVGLGGGAMVHFLQHYDPELKVDAVEIDPAVVRLAEKHFLMKSEGNVWIITADGFKFLAETKERYDVIYMDAFLKPAADTDAAGLPLRLKTLDFYKSLQDKLVDGGLVAFNINVTDKWQEDIDLIKTAFPQAYVFRVPNVGNIIVHGTKSATREKPEVLRAEAVKLDRRFKTNFSFVNVVRSLRP
jgi:spermidine synthase